MTLQEELYPTNRPTDIVVAGLGKSTENFAPLADRYFTVGVNDCDRFFTPEHLVVLDPPHRFNDSRRDIVCKTGAKHVWTTPDWPCLRGDPRRKKITTNRFDRVNRFDIDHKIPHFRTSPFAAIGLAYQLGALRIGLVGVDLLDDHHMHKFADVINEQLAKLSKLLLLKGTILVNISKIARLYSIPTAPLSFIKEKDGWQKL